MQNDTHTRCTHSELNCLASLPLTKRRFPEQDGPLVCPSRIYGSRKAERGHNRRRSNKVSPFRVKVKTIDPLIPADQAKSRWPAVRKTAVECFALCRFADKYSFGKRAPTSYQGSKGTGELYLLETLVFWAKWEEQHPKQGFATYFQAARKQQAGNVTVSDRQVLLSTAARCDRFDLHQGLLTGICAGFEIVPDWCHTVQSIYQTT